DQIRAETRQPANVALRTRAVDRNRVAAEGRCERPVEQLGHRPGVGSGRLHGILVLGRAGLEIPEAARLEPVAGVDERPLRARESLGAAERVVELVDREEGPDAKALDLLQPGIDLALVALR